MITMVSTSDGRSVTYNYDLFNDGTASFVRLIEAVYGDGTRSTYEYSQAEPGINPVLAHAVDPRLVGVAVNMKYEYRTDTNVQGEVLSEINGVSGETMVTRSSRGSDVIVSYANGSTQIFNLPVAQGGRLDFKSSATTSTGESAGSWSARMRAQCSAVRTSIVRPRRRSSGGSTTSGTGDERNNDRNGEIAPAPAHGSGHRLQPQQPSQNGARSRLGAGIDFEHDLALTGAGAIDAAWHERLLVRAKS